MATFRIPVSWEMCGFIRVEADNIYEALKIAEKDSDSYALPKDGEYVNASWRIDDSLEPEAILGCYNSDTLTGELKRIDDVAARLLTLSGRSYSYAEFEKAKTWLTEYMAANQMSLNEMYQFCIQNSDWVLEEIFG